MGVFSYNKYKPTQQIKMKNPKIEDLRVAVVPTETNNFIDQNSSVEQILACSETILYPFTDYFKAQNDEELPIHWSFIIDMSKKTDWTGCNIDGIHQNDKACKIDYIKKVITKWGSTSVMELQTESSPCKARLANVSEFIEEFHVDHVSSTAYDSDDVEVGYANYKYDELDDDLLDEILIIIKDYEVRCKM